MTLRSARQDESSVDDESDLKYGVDLLKLPAWIVAEANEFAYTTQVQG